MGVSINPGDTDTTRMPRSPQSAASPLAHADDTALREDIPERGIKLHRQGGFEPVEHALAQRVIQQRVDLRHLRIDTAGDRGDGHDGSALRGVRQHGLEQALATDQVDIDDLSPGRHDRRDASSMGKSPQRCISGLDRVRQVLDRLVIGDVTGNGRRGSAHLFAEPLRCRVERHGIEVGQQDLVVPRQRNTAGIANATGSSGDERKLLHVVLPPR